MIGVHEPTLRRRSAHDRRRRRSRRGRAPVRGAAPVGRSRAGRRSGSTSPSAPAPSRTGCAAARCGPATTSCGTRATSCSPAPTPGRYTGRRRRPRGRRVDRPARPLVGHPRPRPLPAVAVVPDPARRRLPRRVALGAGQRRPASTPTAAGRAPTAAIRSRSSTSSTTSTWIGADGGPARYGEHGDDGRRPAPARARSPSRAAAASPSRPRAPSTGPTSRSTAAA